MIRKKPISPGIEEKTAVEAQQSLFRHMHKRTISRTSEDLLKHLRLPTETAVPDHVPRKNSEKLLEVPKKLLSKPPTPKNLPMEQLKKPRCLKLAKVSEEENHIRNIIERRKILSPTSLTEPGPSSSPLLKQLQFKFDTEKASLNSSTTAHSFTEENTIGRILYVLEQTAKFDSKILKSISELLMKAPEMHFAIVLDNEKNVKGVYYIETTTGYFHRVLSSEDLPMIIPPRRVKVFLLFNSQKEVFQSALPARFDAIILNA